MLPYYTPKPKNQLPPEILLDPIKFTKACWPNITLYDKQAEVLKSLAENYETTVHAANEVGKDFTASLAVVWWFASRSPARVITSSSGETQLKSILWTEIKERIASSRIPFGWDVKTLRIERELNGVRDELSYVMGQVTRTVENFQGHHLNHDIPRVLCVFDECSAVGDEFHEAAESWAHCILNIGNPMNTVNYFYRLSKKGDVPDPAGEHKYLSKVIHIDGDDSPNVRIGKKLKAQGIPAPYPKVIPGVLSYEEYVRRQAKWDKIKQQIRLHGKFYEGSEALCFPPEWLDAAERSFAALRIQGYDSNAPRTTQAAAMGVDCGAGRDLSVWTLIDRQGVIYQESLVTEDTSKISSKTIELMRRFSVPEDRICFDAGGGGKQIVDHLRSQGFKRLRAVAFGSSPTPPPQRKIKRKDEKVDAKEDQWTYKNKRAEMHGILRMWLDPSINDPVFAIPEELYQLREELACLPMWFDPDGKMLLPPKDKPPHQEDKPNAITIKKLLGRSPDRADSLVLAVYALEKKSKAMVGAMR